MTITKGTQRLPVEALRRLFLFEKLTDEQLQWLAEHGWVTELPSGATVLEEGAPAEVLVVLLSGAIRMSRRVGQDDVEVVRTEQVGVYAGAMQAYVADPGGQTYTSTVRVVSDARFFVLRSEDFAWMMRTWFPIAIHLLEGLFLGMRNAQHIVGQRQQLLALGALSAGLTHELNNPAAAAVRATSALRDRVAGMRHKLAMLAHEELDPRLLELLVDVQEEAVQGVAQAPKLTPLEESEREDEINDWLDKHRVPGGWELAPIFVGAGTTPEFLDKVADGAPVATLEGTLRWLAYTLETELLMHEIADSVTRISSLVAAAKQYSNMDRAPHERADIHAGLKGTLVMLASKLEGIEVVKDFDRSLPKIPVYAGELNQVWTNLIDNAVQAMNGHGTLTVRTSMDGDRARVEIGDTGPGVPERLRQRIFEPFFTTKPVGQGTGLGLDISYRIVVGRHGGDLTVESRPGDTRFIVRLPLTENRQD
ncbi:MAG TPA: ATP-binding protein [Actinomycetes bacterium]|jgi:signal transduction histidine kinase|nr:ATP-binding protein [Actinomycetes bacterium]